MLQVAPLSRSVLRVAGEDRVAFLQGLVSNDVGEAGPGRAVWAALLTPQGKWLSDFLVVADDGDALLLDCEPGHARMLQERLSRFRLRARVALSPEPGLLVSAVWGVEALSAATLPRQDGTAGHPGTVILARDPRLPEAGWRILHAPEAGIAENATEADWDRHRLALGLPEGSRDLDAEKTVLLEAGFDELNGVSWTKGCYMGQELTARTKYRGLLKRRLVPVAVEGPLPERGTPVTRAAADGAEVGEMRSGRDGLGLALLRLEALSAAAAAGGGDETATTAPLRCGEAVLRPRIPAWMRLPARDAA